ncbi:MULTISPECIES: GNAT family N-acetyltransferase [unclassified Streptomyces]|uniref:GNAT family N-acetyltransferase n=1 Tax=unclassified Streptomyces TaxID=2593676 RepID=UPI002E2C50A6|nr:GNAT family protein [Streptomyces sp. NBC_00223]
MTENAPDTADPESYEDTGNPAGEDREICWRGRKVAFTPLDADDAELIQRWRFDPVAAFEIDFWPRSLSALRARLEVDRDDGDRDDFLILLPDGTPVGHVALVEQDIVEGTAEIHMMLDPGHRGQGLGTDALDALTDLAFGELPMHRLEAVTHCANEAALGVLAKSGFVREGVRRSACLHRGRRHDVAVLSLLRPEWEAQNRPRSWDL